MKHYIYILLSLLFFYNNIAQTTIDYETEIQPIFDNSCMPCHGSNQPAAGLNLTSYENVMAGSDDGSIIDIGNYQNSILWQEVSSGNMPNNIANNNMGISDLTTEEVQLIADWILDLQCMVIDCMPEYMCILGECVCINDADGDGICDENEVNLEEFGDNNKIIREFNLLGKENNSNLKGGIRVQVYENGTIKKVNYIK